MTGTTEVDSSFRIKHERGRGGPSTPLGEGESVVARSDSALHTYGRIEWQRGQDR